METLGWKEQEEQIAEMAGVGVDRVEATRRRILDVQAQCMRDEGVWEREYGYVGMSQSGITCADTGKDIDEPIYAWPGPTKVLTLV